MPFCLYPSKPGALTARLYSPTSRLGKSYTPEPFEMVACCLPVSTEVATTFALGITAPEGSLTVPVTSPPLCAIAEVTQSTRSQTAVTRDRNIRGDRRAPPGFASHWPAKS